MDKLSQEIIDCIVSFLPGGPDFEARVWDEKKPSRASYATISHRFRRAVERESFGSITISSGDLQAFEKCLSPSRQASLRTLTYMITLPAIDPARARCFEQPSETEVVSQIFSRRIKQLFHVLLNLNGLQGLSLYLGNVGHARASSPKELGLDYEDGENIEHLRYLRKNLCLVDAGDLPCIDGVLHLSLSNWQRMPTPGLQLDIAARLRGLRTLDVRLDGFETRYPGWLRDGRKSLAEALLRHQDSSRTVSTARFDMSLDDGALVQTRPMPNLTYPERYDRLGACLRLWSERLTNFRVLGVFDESLFWPQPGEKEAPAPIWRHLEICDARLERHTPSGWWYFMPKGHPKYGVRPRHPPDDAHDHPPDSWKEQDSDGNTEDNSDLQYISDTFAGAEDEWNIYSTRDGADDDDMLVRNIPNEETMQPLLEAWAKALGSMPSLRQAKLSFKVEINIGKSDADDDVDMCLSDWEVVYEAPAFEEFWWWNKLNDRERRSRRLIFHNTGGWRPQKGTMDLFQRVGESTHPGAEMMVMTVDASDDIVRSDRQSGSTPCFM